MTEHDLANLDAVADALRKAERIIGQRGWCQAEFMNDRGAVCAVGAVRYAVAESVEPSGMNDEQYRLAEKAAEALYDYIGQNPESWNDEDGRMAIEVRAALLAAAKGIEAAWPSMTC